MTEYDYYWIMSFNFSKKFDFIPNMYYDSKRIDVTYQTKLLGVKCCSDGRWEENSKYLASKGNTRLFFMRRLKVWELVSKLWKKFIFYMSALFWKCWHLCGLELSLRVLKTFWSAFKERHAVLWALGRNIVQPWLILS